MEQSEVSVENKVLEVDDADVKCTNVQMLHYTLKKRPPLSIIIIGGLQNVMMCLPACLAMPFVIADSVCAEYDSPVRTKLFSSTLLMSGICTILQTALGVRLPILQGPSLVFMSVVVAAQKQDHWKCSDTTSRNSSRDALNISYFNSSMPQKSVQLSIDDKLGQLSGSLLAASLFEILIGSTGVVGLLLRFIGPMTVGPTIALLGLSLYKIPIHYASPSWELALTGALTVLIFVSCLGHVKIPAPTDLCCVKTCKQGSRKRRGLQIFQLIPVILSIAVVWSVSGILTYFNVFPSDPSHYRYRARTDAKSQLIHLAPWFYVPHPGQFGMPAFNTALFIGFIGAFFASIIESVGDYFAAAKACEVVTPPKHAVNRGIFVEGIGGLLSGAVGVGYATTSYSANIAAMTLTRTANRSIMFCAGLILITASLIGKFGASLASVPDPALGGALAVIFSMLVSLGLTVLQYVNLNSPRNLLILGITFFSGTMIPGWLDKHEEFTDTGNIEVDNIVKLVLGTPMLLGSLIALILDNIIRGSKKDRGIDVWQKGHSEDKDESLDVDDNTTASQTFGWSCQGWLFKYIPWCFKLPFMPTIHVTDDADVTLVSVKNGRLCV